MSILDARDLIRRQFISPSAGFATAEEISGWRRLR